MTHEFESYYIPELNLDVTGEIEIIETGMSGIGAYEYWGAQENHPGVMEYTCRILSLEVSGPDDYQVTETDRNKAWDWVNANFERLID